MTESALKKYFEGSLSVELLREDIKETIEKTGQDTYSYKVETLHEGCFKVSEDHILKLCNEAIDGHLDADELDAISFALIGSDYFDWDSQRITDTITDWNNQSINFPVTSRNLELWRAFLTSGNYRLPEYNIWSFHLDSQKEICRQNAADWAPINKSLNIGLGGNLIDEPINGLRHPADRGATGWFIWTGEYSDSDDFFSPICAEHLLQLKPNLIRFLGLPAGFRFLTDSRGYLDIWRDDKLLEV